MGLPAGVLAASQGVGTGQLKAIAMEGPTRVLQQTPFTANPPASPAANPDRAAFMANLDWAAALELTIATHGADPTSPA